MNWKLPQVIASICFYSGKAIDLSGEIMEMKFSAVITKEGKWFVSHCPELGVASQGRTKKSALKNLKESVELYLEEDFKETERLAQKSTLTKNDVEMLSEKARKNVAKHAKRLLNESIVRDNFI